MAPPDEPDTPPNRVPDPEEEPTPGERRAARLEDALDIPMALLAVAWAGLTAYELVAPPERAAVALRFSYGVWAIFWVEFLIKLFLSGRPLRFIRRRWPSLLFLIVPALRLFRLFRAFRALRALPAARVIGSSYRAVGTARGLLEGRIVFLLVATAIVVFGSGQMLYLLERGTGTVESLADAIWWASYLAIGNILVFEPETFLARLLAVALSAYSVVVFASVAAALGAFFVESRAERAAAEEGR